MMGWRMGDFFFMGTGRWPGQLEHDELTLGDAVTDQMGAHHADLQ